MQKAPVFQKHHVEPISLYGKNVQENLMVLKEDVHKLLHQKMDISPRYIREAREKLNGVLIYEPKHIEIIGGLQRRFFENLHRLPKLIEDAHKWWARQVYNQEYAEYDKLIEPLKDNPYWLSLPKHHTTVTYQFDKLFDQILDLRKAVSYGNVQLIRYKSLEHFTKKNGK